MNFTLESHYRCECMAFFYGLKFTRNLFPRKQNVF